MVINNRLLLILVITIIAALAIIYRYKIQIKKLETDIRFIKEYKSNLELKTDFQSKEIVNLVNSINDILDVYRESNRTIESGNKKIKETITNLSHDLRTPLTSANGYVQLLLSQDLDEKQKEYASIVYERICTLQKLLEQLFEFSKIEAEEINLIKEKIIINNVLRDIIALYYCDFIDKDIIPVIELSGENFTVFGDRKAFERIFSNIIYNALVHGVDYFSITSEVVHNNMKIVFTNYMEDNNLDNNINQIFDRLYVRDKSRSSNSTGLGLTIAKKYLELMNCSIEADKNGKIFKIIVKI